MLSWPVRIAGWIVGIYAMLKLAASTGAITYTQVFQAWMDQLRDILELGFILKPLTQAVILPALDFIRSLDIHIPDLQDHWQQVFVLTWLLATAQVRNNSNNVLRTLLLLLLVFLATLPFCVAAGTMPVGSLAVAVWPIAGIAAYAAIDTVVDWKAPDILAAAIAVGFVALGYFVGTNSEGPWALLALAGIVGVLGLGFLAGGMLAAEGTFWQRLKDQTAAIGVDITAAMLGAFGLATTFADPPLF
jgi:hypothetical protein